MTLGALTAFGGVLLATSASAAGVSVTPVPKSSAAATAYRYPLAGTSTYFVMTDRYANGSTANDKGSPSGNVGGDGFNPGDPAYFHGGDIKGLTGDCTGPTGLARLKTLGFNSVWITPPFGQNTVQGGSAAYHGYWIDKFDQIDPHFGTLQDFADFTACAKKIGLKVIIDIVANHTGDVIQYSNGYSYDDTTSYKDANGTAFDPNNFTTGTDFPTLNINSFPKTPFVPAKLADVKSPAWLNDVTNYHNRGNIDWNSCAGQCLTWGDFAGLDDLFTEKYNVVQGLADIYGTWAKNYPIAGFRIDTERHVDWNFFKRWLPLVQSMAAAGGNNKFTVFGEDYTTDFYDLSKQVRERNMPSVLDFGFQYKTVSYAAGQGTARGMSFLFSNDDLYTTANTNAYSLQTFLGNHDMGRVGCLLMGDGLSGKSLLNRDLFAHGLLMLLRGNPVVYYGDEIGMTGGGLDTGCGDQAARQDMFRTQVGGWQSEPRIGGTPIGGRSGFSTTATNPIAKEITALNALRAKNPALATGAQITRAASGSLFAVSRIDAKNRAEYLVVFNNGNSALKAVVPSATVSSNWLQIARSDRKVTTKDISKSDKTGKVGLTVPATGWIVLKASKELPGGTPKLKSFKVAVDDLTGYASASVSLASIDPATVSFFTQVVGSGTWQPAGVDDAAPYRVYLDPNAYPSNFKEGDHVAVMALIRSTTGQVIATPVTVTTIPASN